MSISFRKILVIKNLQLQFLFLEAVTPCWVNLYQVFYHPCFLQRYSNSFTCKSKLTETLLNGLPVNSIQNIRWKHMAHLKRLNDPVTTPKISNCMSGRI